jgi:hypothetical protein
VVATRGAGVSRAPGPNIKIAANARTATPNAPAVTQTNPTRLDVLRLACRDGFLAGWRDLGLALRAGLAMA